MASAIPWAPWLPRSSRSRSAWVGPSRSAGPAWPRRSCSWSSRRCRGCGPRRRGVGLGREDSNLRSADRYSYSPMGGIRNDYRRTSATNAIATKRPMTSLRKTALVAGALYLLTFVSIPTLALYGPVRDPNFIVGPGPDTGVLVGGMLEIVVALAGIGTAVALYPVVKNHNEAVAMGFVGSRVLEAGTIFGGVACLLSIVTLRQAGVGTDALLIGHALVAMYDRMFLVGQSFMPAVNALLLGSLLYRARLVPRVLPLLGLIGAPAAPGKAGDRARGRSR